MEFIYGGILGGNPVCKTGTKTFLWHFRVTLCDIYTLWTFAASWPSCILSPSFGDNTLTFLQGDCPSLTLSPPPPHPTPGVGVDPMSKTSPGHRENFRDQLVTKVGQSGS